MTEFQRYKSSFIFPIHVEYFFKCPWYAFSFFKSTVRYSETLEFRILNSRFPFFHLEKKSVSITTYIKLDKFKYLYISEHLVDKIVVFESYKNNSSLKIAFLERHKYKSISNKI